MVQSIPAEQNLFSQISLVQINKLLITFSVQSCYYENEKSCNTVYEENCQFTFSYGKLCEKTPTKQCEDVEVIL